MPRSGPDLVAMPSEFVREVQRMYFRMFGGKDMSKAIAARESAIVPRSDRRTGTTIDKVKVKPTKKGWMCERQKQMENLASRSSILLAPPPLLFDRPVGAPSVMDVVDAAAAQLWSSEREEKRLALVTAGQSINKGLELDRAPRGGQERKRKLEEMEKGRIKTLDARAKVRMSSVGENAHLRLYIPKDAPFRIFGESLLGDNNSSRAMLERVYGKACAATSLRAACNPRITHCFVPSMETEARLKWPSLAALLARLLGGTLVEQHWLDLSHAAGRLIISSMKFRRALGEQRYFFIHRSFREECRPIVKMLEDILKHTPMDQRRWYFKDSHQELPDEQHSITLVAASEKDLKIAAVKDWREKIAAADKAWKTLKAQADVEQKRAGCVSASLARRLEIALAHLGEMKKSGSVFPLKGAIWGWREFWNWLDQLDQ